MTPVICLRVSLTREQVVEKYGIPASAAEEFFSLIQPSFGSGESARYLEADIDQQLDDCGWRNRPAVPHPKSSLLKEDMAMQGSRSLNWADTVERQELHPTTAPVEPLLVDEKAAGLMLGVSRRTIFDMNKQGVLRSKTIGKRKLYSVADLRAFANGEGA